MSEEVKVDRSSSQEDQNGAASPQVQVPSSNAVVPPPLPPLHHPNDLAAEEDSNARQSTDKIRKYIEAILAFEDQRHARSQSIFLRNRAYWTELRKLQKEGLEDAQSISKYIRSKVNVLKQCAVMMNHEQPIPEVPSSRRRFTKQSAGSLARDQFAEMEHVYAKAYLHAAEKIEKEVIPVFHDKLSIYEKDIQLLWKRGKLLFLSWLLIDARVQFYFKEIQEINKTLSGENLFQSFSFASIYQPSAARDIWLLGARYSTAVNKFNQVMEDCNKQFHVLFLLAKDVETTRVGLITRTSENYCSKMIECWQAGALASKNALDNSIQIPSMLVANQSTMGDELTRRVNEESAEKGNFDTVANFDLLLKHQVTPSEPSTQLFEEQEVHVKISELSAAISSPALNKMFLCYLEEPGIIVSAWMPIIVTITENRWLHMFSFTHDHETHPSLESCFVKFAKSQKLFFEDELSNYIHPLLSADKSTANKQHTNHKVSTMDSTLKKLDEHVTFEDLETNEKLEQVHSLIEPLLAEEKFLEPLASINMKYSTVAMKPSPLPNESVVAVTESLPVEYSIFTFWMSNERKYVLKARNQRETVELISSFTH